MMHNSSSSISNVNKSKRILEKKSSMENINSNMIKKLHNSKSTVKFEIISNDDNKKQIKPISNNKSKEPTMNLSNNDLGSKTYRKPQVQKDLLRDSSKSDLQTKISKHNRNNSYDVTKEKPTTAVKKPTNNNNIINNNYPNQSNLPFFNNINIYAANMNNFKTNEVNFKQFIVNQINNNNNNNKKAIACTNQKKGMRSSSTGKR